LIFWECPRQPARIQIENRVYYQIIDFKIFLKFLNFVHSAKHFPKLSIYKKNSPCCALAPCYISNQSLNQKNFNEFLKFFQEPGNKTWDESGAEEVRDGPMVFLAKMILMTSTFTLHWDLRAFFCNCQTLEKKLPHIIIFWVSDSYKKSLLISKIVKWDSIEQSNWKIDTILLLVELKTAEFVWKF
jgi:hypothetical protein